MLHQVPQVEYTDHHIEIPIHKQVPNLETILGLVRVLSKLHAEDAHDWGYMKVLLGHGVCQGFRAP